jgi:low affinity Fe/Cu permease
MNSLFHLLPKKGSNNRSHPAAANVNDLHEQSLTVTERFCQKIGESTGAPITLVAVIVFQLIWIILGQITKMDPFPYIFMLTVSNVVQLILIVVLAVAGKQQASHAEIRAEEDHASLSRMLYHQQTQEAMLLDLAAKAGIDVTEYTRAVNELAAGPGTIVPTTEVASAPATAPSTAPAPAT